MFPSMYISRVLATRLIPISIRMRSSSGMKPVSTRLCRFTSLPPVLILFGVFSGSFGVGQDSSPGFWELPSQKMDAMRFPLPSDNGQRYARLRQYFSDLHCEPTLMEAQAIPKHSAKNLICVLPGRDTEQILVVARYDQRDTLHDAAEGWSEAVMLPLLYNAMLAAKRQHTFVFAELCGRAGQNAFLDSLRKKRRQSPKAMVVLDVLGLSGAWFYTFEGMSLSAKGREQAAIRKELNSDAAFTARLQGVPISINIGPAETGSSLMSQADTIPSILIHSVLNADVPAPTGALRQNFEFLAYYLGRIDLRLTITPSPSQP
jgi:hypothetical protein